MRDSIKKNGIVLAPPVYEDGILLDGHTYTMLSPHCSWPDGVTFCDRRGKVLWSLDTAVKFLADYEHGQGSCELYMTRTIVGWLKDDRAYVCDIPSDKILYVRDEVRGMYGLEVRIESEIAKMVINLGKNRRFAAADINAGLSIKRDRWDSSEYDQNASVQALMPTNAKKLTATMRYIKPGRNKEQTQGALMFRARTPKSGYMHIHPVVLWGKTPFVVGEMPFHGRGCGYVACGE